MKMLKQRLESVSPPGKTRYQLIVSFSYLIIGILVSLSMAWEYDRIGTNFETMARERAVVLFKQIELVREWNFLSGEVYIPATAAALPDQRQKHPAREVSTPGGKRLTRVEPGQMLRQIAELASLSGNTDGIRYHLIASRPDQQSTPPDPWEVETLELFEQQEIKERISFVDGNDSPVHRYMAPLAKSPACLKCPHKAGKPEEALGGFSLSITIPAEKLVAIRIQQIRHMLLIHLASFILIAGLVHLVARRTFRHLDKLAKIAANQQCLIEERTADLSVANVLLASEVDERRHNQALLEENEARYRSILESTHDGIAVAQGNQLTFANSRLAEMLGVPLEEIIGAEWVDFIHPEDRKMTFIHQANLVRGGASPDGFRVRMLHRDEAIQQITVDLHVAQLKNTGNDNDAVNADLQWVLSVKDVSDRVRSEHDQQLAAAVFNSTAEAIMVTDNKNRIILVNPAFTRITGYQAAEAIGQYPTLLHSGRHDKQFFTEMWKTIKETGHWAGEIWNRRKDGHLYVEWLSITAVRNGNEEAPQQNSECNYVGTFTDITKRKEAEDLLRHKASHDLLTDLPNRGLFEDRLQLAISQAKRYHRSIALLYIDFDHFKEVNDTLGHAAGDELLSEAARRMGLCIRESDTLSRFGGDEFAAILTDVSGLEEVEEVGSRMVATLAEPFQLAHGRAEISGSVGIAIYPDHGSTAEILKYNADIALYNVKQNLRNAYRIYSPDLPGVHSRKN